MTNKNHTVLYTGMTNELERRVWEHKNKAMPNSFTSKYNCNKLIYFEEFSDANEAIHREKQLKKYKRDWKEHLINKFNSSRNDLAENWYSGETMPDLFRHPLQKL